VSNLRGYVEPMKINPTTFICLFAIVFLYGCETVGGDIEIFNKKKICCSGYDDMLTWKWDGENSFTSDLKGNAPIYIFDEGRSRFTAMEFTTNMDNIKLRISARNNNSYDQKALFYPAVTFLDTNKKKINLDEKDKLKILNIYTSGGPESTADASVLVPRGAKYAIIHSARTNFGQADTVAATKTGNMVAAGGIYFYIPGYATEYKFLYSPSAAITVRVDKN